MKFGIAILAAGTSSRLGEAKQLLRWGDDSTLLEHAIAIALQSELGPVAVILGHQAEMIEKKICNLDVEVIENSEFDLGQGTSVHAAVQWATFKGLEGLLLMVCDQPHLKSDDLNKLATSAPMKGIAAALYGAGDGGDASGEVGVPVFFMAEFFAELLEIPDDQGAKSVLLENHERVTGVDLGDRVHDIDNKADYEKARKK